MFDVAVEELEGAVDKLDIPLDGSTLVRLAGVFSRLEAKLTLAFAGFDKAKLWELDAEVSMTAWLRERAGMSTRTASRIVAAGRRVSALPATATAWQEGRLSSGQVEAITGVLNQRSANRFAQDEQDFLPELEGLSVADTASAVRAWREHLDDEPDGSDGSAAAEPERTLHLSSTFGGQWRLDGDLDPESGQLVHTAIRLAQTADVEGEPLRTAGTKRADALVDVCKFFLDHQTGTSGGRHRPHLNVVVDIDDVQKSKGGRFVEPDGCLDGPATSALLCDSFLHRVITSGGSAILDYGTSTRAISPQLWNALVIRDRHCRFPGCDRPSWWCDGHHVIHVEHGGATSLENLILGCRRHHRILHLPGWHAKLRADGTLEITLPDGTVRTSRPPGILR